jgi:hypothetical protein
VLPRVHGIDSRRHAETRRKCLLQISADDHAIITPVRPCDLTLDSNTALLVDAGSQLILWLGANLALPATAPVGTLVRAVSTGAPVDARVPAWLRAALDVARACGAGRVPAPELLVCREGEGNERHALARLAPTAKDPQSVIFALLPHLERLHHEDPEYAAAMLTHIARRLPPTDSPSLLQWADSLAIELRGVLTDTRQPGTASETSQQHGAAAETMGRARAARDTNGGDALGMQLAAARLSAEQEAKAQQARSRVRLSAPVDQTLVAGRRGQARSPAQPAARSQAPVYAASAPQGRQRPQDAAHSQLICGGRPPEHHAHAQKAAATWQQTGADMHSSAQHAGQSSQAADVMRGAPPVAAMQHQERPQDPPVPGSRSYSLQSPVPSLMPYRPGQTYPSAQQVASGSQHSSRPANGAAASRPPALFPDVPVPP